MTKKIYITKKRDRELDIALTLDDYMYEKYKRMMDDIKRQE